jgi:transposase InsO family protein
MTQDDVLFGYRLQLFDLAARTNVSHACRTFGVHRSTYYRWKKQVDASGLEMLRPRERRRPRMPNAFPRIVEERILAFAIANPGLGPRRLSAQLERQSGLRASQNGIWRVLRRHGLSTRAKRLALVAGYRAPYEPPREQEPEPHVESTRPGELVGFDSFFVGRLHGTKGAVWQLTACDTYSSFGWAELVRCPSGQPDQAQTSRFARRVANDLARRGWRLERVITDNGNEFNRPGFSTAIERLGAAQTRIKPGRPQANGHVERLHRTILEECWRPAFARYLQVRFRGLKRELETYIHTYNFDRAHTGEVCAGLAPGDLVYGARKMEPR